MAASNKEILVGRNAVHEVLKAGKRKVWRIFWAVKSNDEKSNQLAELIRSKSIPLTQTTLEKITQWSGSNDHQGIAAEVAPFEYAELGAVVKAAKANQKGGFLLLLDEIQDPHNVGALIRTAHLCGADGLVLLKHRQALITPSVCKAASGAQEYLSIVQEVNLVNVINYLKNNDFSVWGASGKGDVPLYKTEPQFPLALVLGGEGKGLRRLTKENCDVLVTIPMEGQIDSFNVSVAGGIFMAEIMRNKLLSS
ncbi:MAG: 23S rRNA (guanosine(2251)-2'-O)-methyltransferase RlmB [Deltaproteobacteria bacterium RIFCSPLOWO2_01_44_7]|nr:MAG: 23S rRNA (guanosine(2251)-2'-O)-methyltransferase RlmB [Deltaproteobacteria bacterium RIFCSPHIGHO2_01_FULL_43_49]OGQ16483.1 MAG: 23S rRNA (guanosine(2251)-2'-O)-methyltransferase RlmB [Deltaproteobacteria bacterium RIFCSPHIGHO2_02_FULL_44_53]OGQ27689.1 MAG: 23S rRNA (guanosine(2251)-2'-O)-methyltransferase RlmB [Deltaproteobacteria bacterium RIFCSPHIGHO2_12_FULL_44_21]OGQ33001.1 MAG: 23S rRNA (guanosine(2251)-2'-O)-methyltransferase RlmB [Deltaproteobacteria bacterium RIFCSPLOWO2_01_FULL